MNIDNNLSKNAENDTKNIEKNIEISKLGWIYINKMINIYKSRYKKSLRNKIIVDCDLCKKIITYKSGFHKENKTDLCVFCMKILIKDKKINNFTII